MGTIRIVTTNYDRHLSACLPVGTLVYEAPDFPGDGDFAGVVHLHGSVDQEPGRLVVTEGGFARSHMQWNSPTLSFLHRLFASHTVLFVGYSVEGTLMRYIRQATKTSAGIYALTRNPDSPQWAELGVEPVGYRSHDDLPGLLGEWAERSAASVDYHDRRVARITADTHDIEDLSPPRRVLPDRSDRRPRLGPHLHQSRDLLNLLNSCATPEDDSLFLELVDRAFTPQLAAPDPLQVYFGLYGPYQTAIADPAGGWLHESVDMEYWSRRRHLAADLLAIFDGHLRRVCRIEEVASNPDPYDTRSAIEAHNQDRGFGDRGFLVDAARDLIELLIDDDPQDADGHLASLAASAHPILNRLAIHGQARRTDITAEAKIE